MKAICPELFELTRHIKSVDRPTMGQTDKAITIGLLHFQLSALVAFLNRLF